MARRDSLQCNLVNMASLWTWHGLYFYIYFYIWSGVDGVYVLKAGQLLLNWVEMSKKKQYLDAQQLTTHLLNKWPTITKLTYTKPCECFWHNSGAIMICLSIEKSDTNTIWHTLGTFELQLVLFLKSVADMSSPTNQTAWCHMTMNKWSIRLSCMLMTLMQLDVHAP